MSELTDERLAELRQIAEAAIPGPWIAAGPSFGDPMPRYLNEVIVDDDTGETICTAPAGTEESSDEIMEHIAAFDPPTALALLGEIESLRSEVREWMCDQCNTVYPGPPQPGFWCAQCPRCGGDTAPRGVIERRRLEREVLAEAVKLREEVRKANVAFLHSRPGEARTAVEAAWAAKEAAEDAHEAALALLDGEKGGGGA